MVQLIRQLESQPAALVHKSETILYKLVLDTEIELTFGMDQDIYTMLMGEISCSDSHQ